MTKHYYKTPLSEEIESITEEVLANSVEGAYSTPDLTEEDMTW